jgi:hypothetical protein
MRDVSARPIELLNALNAELSTIIARHAAMIASINVNP